MGNMGNSPCAKIDKDCKGGPNGFAFSPYQFAIWAYLLDLPIFCHPHQFSALPVLTFPISFAPTDFLFYHMLPIFTILATCGFYYFHAYRFPALSALTFLPFCAPLQVYHFTNFIILADWAGLPFL